MHKLRLMAAALTGLALTLGLVLWLGGRGHHRLLKLAEQRIITVEMIEHATWTGVPGRTPPGPREGLLIRIPEGRTSLPINAPFAVDVVAMDSFGGVVGVQTVPAGTATATVPWAPAILVLREGGSQGIDSVIPPGRNGW